MTCGATVSRTIRESSSSSQPSLTSSSSSSSVHQHLSGMLENMLQSSDFLVGSVASLVGDVGGKELVEALVGAGGGSGGWGQQIGGLLKGQIEK